MGYERQLLERAQARWVLMSSVELSVEQLIFRQQATQLDQILGCLIVGDQLPELFTQVDREHFAAKL